MTVRQGRWDGKEERCDKPNLQVNATARLGSEEMLRQWT